MCDYSLHGIKNRLANEGEQLFVQKFHTGSKGLASVTDKHALEGGVGSGIWDRAKAWFRRAAYIDASKALPAVCIPPGARLQISGIPVALQRQFKLDGPNQEVTFVQMTAEPFRYRDAVRFHNGQEVLLQKLSDGLEMTVMSLSLAEETFAPQPAARYSLLEQVSVG